MKTGEKTASGRRPRLLSISPESGFFWLVALVALVIVVLAFSPHIERWIDSAFQAEQRRNQARRR